MADNYGKGNILYKLLILVLLAVLVGSIYYPKTLWEAEAGNAKEGHYRMSNLYSAELQYQTYHQAYTDSLEGLISFIKDDSTYKQYVDSSFTTDLNAVIADLDSLREQQIALDSFYPTVSPTDTLMLDSLQARIDEVTLGARVVRDKMQLIAEKLKNHPCSPIAFLEKAREVIERKDFFMDYLALKNMVVQNKYGEAQKASDDTKAKYEEIVTGLVATRENLSNIFTLVDSLRYCPTNRKPYNLSVIDTSVIKIVVIECPIDSAYIAEVENDFVKSTIGALKIENHGKIENGEKSWEGANKKKE